MELVHPPSVFSTSKNVTFVLQHFFFHQLLIYNKITIYMFCLKYLQEKMLKTLFSLQWVFNAQRSVRFAIYTGVMRLSEIMRGLQTNLDVKAGPACFEQQWCTLTFHICCWEASGQQGRRISLPDGDDADWASWRRRRDVSRETGRLKTTGRESLIWFLRENNKQRKKGVQQGRNVQLEAENVDECGHGERCDLSSNDLFVFLWISCQPWLLLPVLASAGAINSCPFTNFPKRSREHTVH